MSIYFGKTSSIKIGDVELMAGDIAMIEFKPIAYQFKDLKASVADFEDVSYVQPIIDEMFQAVLRSYSEAMWQEIKNRCPWCGKSHQTYEGHRFCYDMKH